MYSHELLGMMQDCSANMDLNEVVVVDRSSGVEIQCHDGTKLFCPHSILENCTTATERKIKSIMQYLFRYKFAQFIPYYMPRIEKMTEYNSILNIRIEHGFDGAHENYLYNKNIFTLKKGDIVFEGGAFIGFSTVHMAQRVGETGYVISCETQVDNFATLISNIQQNNLNHVLTVNCAICGHNRKLEFYEGGNQTNSVKQNVIKHVRKHTVQGYTIEHVCKLAQKDPNFIILTINGAELDALVGSEKYIAQLKNTRIIAVGMYKDELGTIGPRIKFFLENIGYKVFGEKTLYAYNGE